MSLKNGPLCNRRKEAHPTISTEGVPSLVMYVRFHTHTSTHTHTYINTHVFLVDRTHVVYVPSHTHTHTYTLHGLLRAHGSLHHLYLTESDIWKAINQDKRPCVCVCVSVKRPYPWSHKHQGTHTRIHTQMVTNTGFYIQGSWVKVITTQMRWSMAGSGWG